MAKDIIIDINKKLKEWGKNPEYPVIRNLISLMESRFPREKGLAEELVLFFLPKNPDDRDGAYKLAAVADLFDFNFDEESDILEDRDWIFLRDLMNSRADTLDMDLVTYIMGIIVSRGQFD
jgi:hypothetical protein